MVRELIVLGAIYSLARDIADCVTYRERGHSERDVKAITIPYTEHWPQSDSEYLYLYSVTECQWKYKKVRFDETSTGNGFTVLIVDNCK